MQSKIVISYSTGYPFLKVPLHIISVSTKFKPYYSETSIANFLPYVRIDYILITYLLKYLSGLL